MASELLRDKERNQVLNALQRRDDFLRDLERAERCGIDCRDRKKRAKACYDYLAAVDSEFISGPNS